MPITDPTIIETVETYIGQLTRMGWGIREVGQEWFSFLTASAPLTPQGELVLHIVLDREGPIYLTVDRHDKVGDHPIRQLKLLHEQVDWVVSDPDLLHVKQFNPETIAAMLNQDQPL